MADVSEIYDELFCVKVKANRLMRSENARKHRKEIRDIKEKHLRKENEDKQHLMEKHKTLMDNKRKG